jgi:hypothetical protein
MNENPEQIILVDVEFEHNRRLLRKSAHFDKDAWMTLSTGAQDQLRELALNVIYNKIIKKNL